MDSHSAGVIVGGLSQSPCSIVTCSFDFARGDVPLEIHCRSVASLTVALSAPPPPSPPLACRKEYKSVWQLSRPSATFTTIHNMAPVDVPLLRHIFSFADMETLVLTCRPASFTCLVIVDEEVIKRIERMFAW